MVMSCTAQYFEDSHQIKIAVKNPFACLFGRNLEGDSQLYMEIQRTKKGHGILEGKQRWKSHTTRYQNSLQSQLLRWCGAGGRINGREQRIQKQTLTYTAS